MNQPTPLAQRMAEKGYSITSLSKATGVARTTIHDLMTKPGWIPRKPETIERLCKVLGLHPMEILQLPDEQGSAFNYYTAKRLFEAVTCDGRLSPQHFHAWASAIRKASKGKAQAFELALRGIALVLEDLEIARKQRKVKRLFASPNQLPLPLLIPLASPVSPNARQLILV